MRKSRYNKTRKPTLKYFKKRNTKNVRKNVTGQLLSIENDMIK